MLARVFLSKNPILDNPSGTRRIGGVYIADMKRKTCLCALGALMLLWVALPLAVLAQKPPEPGTITDPPGKPPEPTAPQINLSPDLPPNLRPERLSDVVNSAADELLPIISADDQALFYTRENYSGNITARQDIWMSRRQPNGEWGPPERLPEPINNAQNNAVLSVSPDGNTLLLLNTYRADGTMGNGISITTRKGDTWALPTDVVIEDYHNRSNYGEYCLHSSGNILVMTVQRDQTQGDKDLYVSFRQEDGTWSRPQNLGPTVNTAQAEATPFLAPDGRTLYFASKGHPGYGNQDMFVSRRIGEGWTEWTTPLNLGPNINSPRFDAYFTIPASGRHAYYSSAGASGNPDIFRIELPPSLRPQPVCILRGRVLNRNTSQPIGGRVSYYDFATGAELGQAQSDPTTGAYQIVLPLRAQYGLRAESEGFISVHEQVNLDSSGVFVEATKDLFLVPLVTGQAVRLNNVLFDTDSDVLRPISRRELDHLATLMQHQPTLRFEIQGHTDSRGTREHNLGLSQRRAAAVRTYLIGKGIDASRLTSRGFGPDKPAATNDTEAGRQQNRRVEAVVQ